MTGIIDFHAHVYPETVAARIRSSARKSLGVVVPGSGTASGLIESMHSSGISWSAILPVARSHGEVHGLNKWVLSLSGDGLIPLGAIYPSMPGLVAELDMLKSSGFPGVKIAPIIQRIFPDDPLCDDLYEALIERDMLLVAHAGRGPVGLEEAYGSPERFSHVVESYPELKLVLAHLGGLRMWGDVRRHLLPLTREKNNLFFDTSYASLYLNTEEMEDIIKEAGPGRILFGTDYPWAEAGRELEIIRGMDLSRDEVESILFQNGADLLGLG